MTSWASYPYQDNVVLITGAGSGIGRAITRAFLEQGASVAAIGRRSEPLVETVAGFEDRALVIPADAASAPAIRAAVEQTIEHFGRLDVVIANAGLSEPSDIDELDHSSWERMRSLNLDGLVYLAEASVPALRASRGTLIAISSIAGLGGDWKQFGYNATKGGVNTLVQSLALDLGADGVRVNAIAPAFTETAQTRERLENPEFHARLMDRVALDRAAVPEDIATVALWLASPDAGYVTGVILPVDGGTTASSGTPRPM